MSFLDELNEISKTPEEAAAEKKIESYNDGKKWAISTIDHIKNVIREKAKNGDYETICGKRYMKFYADDLYPSSYLFENIRNTNIGRMLEFLIDKVIIV